MEPSAEATEPNHDPHHIGIEVPQPSEMQPPTPSGSASSRSSSSASSSSQSTPKAELRRRIMELEANLSEATQDLWQANEVLGLNRWVGSMSLVQAQQKGDVCVLPGAHRSPCYNHQQHPLQHNHEQQHFSPLYSNNAKQTVTRMPTLARQP